MGIRRQRSTVHAVPAMSSVNAAAGTYSQIGQFYTYSVGAYVERAQSIPTLTRAQNLLVSMVAGLDLEQYTMQWTGEDYEEVVIPGESWMTRPDPRVSRQFIVGSTVGDLFWHGRAFWYVTSRFASGYPATFTWLPAGNVNTVDQPGPIWFGPSDQVQFNGNTLDSANVVQFISPTPGVLFTGARSIDIAIRLDNAAKRAASPIASGYLQQTGGEPMTSDELSELAGAWTSSRSGTEQTEGNTVGALNEFVKFVEFSADPSKMQLSEGREYSSLELSRVANIPPYLLGISTGGMTYQNAQEAMKQLYLLGARPIMQTIEQTLSLDNILPRGRFTRFDLDDMFENDRLADEMATADTANSGGMS
ncbi:Bacteriophage/Gene transfer agent portal protein [uncultured Caudovirales phage]|uniref:Bacteriophage/Gene transfer agent portal protein n=1 Tax=uncultured Caudovirales phage TaxID=2100421 RepID=A0A6J5T3J8_9CAUD|nr:Bacteriophage/Gene transfer agent portal protein [uncultured Caudovirales phage]CAB4222218.1 Bacteriophage/Gene transfer agent portal protein [uncultured Caudovirales phage]